MKLYIFMVIIIKSSGIKYPYPQLWSNSWKTLIWAI